jgi:Flp pilus assembly protein TadB
MYSLIPLILTILALIPIIALSVYIIITKNKKQKKEMQMNIMIDEALDYNQSFRKRNDESILNKFLNKYKELMIGAGIINPNTTQKELETKFLLISLIIYLFAFVFGGFNIFIGIIPVVIFFAALYVYCTNKISNIQRLMDEQVPSFLSTLKSNIQSNQTPERALISAIDNTADPLYSELKIVKSLIETGTFETAMSTLRVKTHSETLKFLCSCIELSTDVGSNLENQIVVIEEMINNRKTLDRKLKSAEAENKPLLYVSMIVIPGLFIYMYFMNSQTRDFWFKAPISWLLFGIIVLMCLFGIWAGNKVIDNVKKM